MAIRTASTTQIVQIHKLLTDLLEPVYKGATPEDSLVIYKGDHNDASVAAAISGNVSSASVARVRREMFGQVKIGRKPSIEARAEREAILTIADRFNRFIAHCAVHHGIQAKHLSVSIDTLFHTGDKPEPEKPAVDSNIARIA